MEVRAETEAQGEEPSQKESVSAAPSSGVSASRRRRRSNPNGIRNDGSAGSGQEVAAGRSEPRPLQEVGGWKVFEVASMARTLAIRS